MVDRHYRALWSYVSFLTGGASETEDMVHEAFLLAFDRLAAGDEFSGDPGSWLRGVARNLVYGWWRKQRRMPKGLADRMTLVIDESDDAATMASMAEVRAALEHCLAKLPVHDRGLVAKRYEEGLRIVAIAQTLKANVSSVRVRLFRIRQALRACVERQLPGWSTP